MRLSMRVAVRAFGTLNYAYSVPFNTLQGKSMNDDEYNDDVLPTDPQQALILKLL